jgi:hypothetical protein
MFSFMVLFETRVPNKARLHAFSVLILDVNQTCPSEIKEFQYDRPSQNHNR